MSIVVTPIGIGMMVRVLISILDFSDNASEQKQLNKNLSFYRFKICILFLRLRNIPSIPALIIF